MLELYSTKLPVILGKPAATTAMQSPPYCNHLKGGDLTSYKASGLPNITGNYTFQSLRGGVYSGCFIAGSTATGWNGDMHEGRYSGLGFDASQANEIYGNSEIVQPPALQLITQVKY